jgi:hypothetical protein
MWVDYAATRKSKENFLIFRNSLLMLSKIYLKIIFFILFSRMILDGIAGYNLFYKEKKQLILQQFKESLLFLHIVFSWL